MSIKRGKISSYDKDSEDLYLLQRNLDFQSNITEFSSNFEFNFSPYKIGSKNLTKLYIYFQELVGLNITLKDIIMVLGLELQPLGTEGQGSFLYPERENIIYFLLGIPIGLGYKFNLNN